MSAITQTESKVEQAVPNAPWPMVRVRDIADSIQYGLTASAVQKTTGPRFLRITDIQDGRVEWNSVPSCTVSAEDIPKYRLVKGDLVFARTGATTGKSFLIGDCPEAVFASYLIRVRVSQGVDSRFLAAFFQSPDYWSQVEAGKRGIGQPNVNGTVLGEIRMPVPPIPDQCRIVAEIEKQLTRLDSGVAALRRVQANLKRYRAAVLKAAIGADSAPCVSLVELAEPGAKILYGILQPGPEAADGVPYVRPSEIYLDKIQLGEIRKTTAAIATKYKRSTLQSGDVILSIVGTIGKVATVPAELTGGNITQSSVRIRPNKKLVKGDYLAWVLRSPFATKQYDTFRLGTAVPRLNVAHVRDLQIPLPTLSAQKLIVAEVERRLSVIDELETVVTANLARATRLRQAILHRSFTS